MPAERTLSRPSEQRRSNKPIMEKRRRARINHCLNELKALILEALRKDPARHSKLEKADILEMTVKHLQNIQRQQMALAVATDPTVMSKFRAGFNECAGEVSRYVSRIEGVEPGIRQRLLGHLTNCLTGLNSMAPLAFAGVAAAASGTQGGGPVSHVGMPHSLNVVPQLPFPVGDLNNNTAAAAAAAARMLGGLPLIPSRLPSGEIAFLLPSQAVPLFSPSSASSASASAAPTATVTCNTDNKTNTGSFSTSRTHPPPPSTSPVSPVSTCTSGSSAFSPPIRDEPAEVKPSLSPPPPPGFPRQTYVSCPASTSSREEPTQPSPSAPEHDRMWRPW